MAQMVEIKYCCDNMKYAIHGLMNAVHISENKKDMDIAPFYMNVETNEGIKVCFLKFCPECGKQLSEHKW